MTDASPTVHDTADLDAATALAAELTDAARERTSTGLHVVVLVTEDGNTAFGRFIEPASIGTGSQRWLKHARRGASPGGWTEGHHPRSEHELGVWRELYSARLDKLLIERSKTAWKCEGTAPYVVEFAPEPFDD